MCTFFLPIINPSKSVDSPPLFCPLRGFTFPDFFASWTLLFPRTLPSYKSSGFLYCYSKQTSPSFCYSENVWKQWKQRQTVGFSLGIITMRCGGSPQKSVCNSHHHVGLFLFCGLLTKEFKINDDGHITKTAFVCWLEHSTKWDQKHCELLPWISF